MREVNLSLRVFKPTVKATSGIWDEDDGIYVCVLYTSSDVGKDSRLKHWAALK
jgi:hypothetical protein